MARPALARIRRFGWGGLVGTWIALAAMLGFSGIAAAADCPPGNPVDCRVAAESARNPLIPAAGAVAGAVVGGGLGGLGGGGAGSGAGGTSTRSAPRPSQPPAGPPPPGPPPPGASGPQPPDPPEPQGPAEDDWWGQDSDPPDSGGSVYIEAETDDGGRRVLRSDDDGTHIQDFDEDGQLVGEEWWLPPEDGLEVSGVPGAPSPENPNVRVDHSSGEPQWWEDADRDGVEERVPGPSTESPPAPEGDEEPWWDDGGGDTAPDPAPSSDPEPPPEPEPPSDAEPPVEEQPAPEPEPAAEAEPPPEPPAAIPVGTQTYYEDRLADFRRRNPGAKPPGYYENYGDKYLERFTQLGPELSPAGQRWMERTLRNLQELMEQERIRDPERFAQMELDDGAFTRFAYDSHPRAYIDGGLFELPATDLARIVMTPDAADLITGDGVRQIVDVLQELEGADVLNIAGRTLSSASPSDYYEMAGNLAEAMGRAGTYAQQNPEQLVDVGLTLAQEWQQWMSP